MREDLKVAFRSLAAAPSFTGVALVVLTLGIGATTAICSVVDAVALRPLPFEEPDRLVALGERQRQPADAARTRLDPEAMTGITPQNYADIVETQKAFESIAAVAVGEFVLREPGAPPENVSGQRVTASFFDVLRRQPLLGRPFTAENEVEGRHRVVVLSHRFWMNRFGGDPGIIGRSIPIEGGPYEVVGVMPQDFEWPIGAAEPNDIWVPYVIPADERIRTATGISWYLQGIARLKPGVSLEHAQADVDRIAAGIEAAFPGWNPTMRPAVRPLLDHIVGAETRRWMLMLLGAVAMVLLIACANVATLLLARGSAREREIAVRAALGAGRWRLLRQLMTESVLLSVMGTLAAVAVAWWTVDVLKAAMPSTVPRAAAISVDFRVLAAAALLSLVSAVLFGLVPALQLSSPDLTRTLRDGGPTGASRARRNLRGALVVAEVALAVVLLVGAALFIGSFRNLMKIDPGFDPRNVLVIGAVPRLERVAPGGGPPDYGPDLQRAVERVQQLAGVLHAGVISGGAPLGFTITTALVSVPGRTLAPQDARISVRRVTPDYHRAIGIPLKAGRYFDAGDRAGGQSVVIISESAARKYFDGDAIGKSIGMSGADHTIVGVVGDIRQGGLETEPRAEAYVPTAQGRTFFSEFVIKTAEDPRGMLPQVRAAVLAEMPDVLLVNVRTMEEVISRATAQRRLNMLLVGLFGVLGLAIAAAGVYGVIAYLTAQRTREIGVRMALGATRGEVVGLVLRNATGLLTLGLAIGAFGAWILSSAAAGFLFRMDARDPRAYAAAIATLAVAALMAAAIPARRAAQVDPVRALRAE